MELAGRDEIVRTVRATVDVEGAHTANAFAAVVVERDRLFAFFDQVVVENVKHFQERSIGRDSVDAVGFETSLRLSVFLTPNFKCEFHRSYNILKLIVNFT